MHLAAGIPTAAATGGASIPGQLALAGGTYAAKKLAELATKRAALRLDQLLRRESPLYRGMTARTELSPMQQALLSGILAARPELAAQPLQRF